MKFSVKSGETVAIIGPSGMGKTTIAKLIHRLYDPSSGQVCCIVPKILLDIQ